MDTYQYENQNYSIEELANLFEITQHRYFHSRQNKMKTGVTLRKKSDSRVCTIDKAKEGYPDLTIQEFEIPLEVALDLADYKFNKSPSRRIIYGYGPQRLVKEMLDSCRNFIAAHPNFKNPDFEEVECGVYNCRYGETDTIIVVKQMEEYEYGYEMHFYYTIIFEDKEGSACFERSEFFDVRTPLQASTTASLVTLPTLVLDAIVKKYIAPVDYRPTRVKQYRRVFTLFPSRYPTFAPIIVRRWLVEEIYANIPGKSLALPIDSFSQELTETDLLDRVLEAFCHFKEPTLLEVFDRLRFDSKLLPEIAKILENLETFHTTR